MPKYIKELSQKELEFQMFVLEEDAKERLSRGEDIIKLTIGISDLPEPSEVLEKMSSDLYDFQRSHQVFPEGLPELRSAICDYYNNNYGTRVESKQVVINAGTSAIFRNLFQIASGDGFEVMLPRPYYSLYRVSAELAGANIKYYDIDPVTLRLNIDSFRNSFDKNKTSVVVINSPGNPIGNILSKEEIIEIYKIIDGNAFVIHDDIYANTSFYEKHVSPLSYLGESDRDISIITNGFSKGFRMYTKRVGYAILPDPLVMPMRIVQQHTLLTHDPVNQYGMVEALKHLEYPVELTRIHRERAEFACELLQDTGCVPIKPMGGFYLVLDCGNWNNDHGIESSISLAKDILARTGVAVVPGTDFGLNHGLRLSLCNSRWNEAITRLRSYFLD